MIGGCLKTGQKRHGHDTTQSPKIPLSRYAVHNMNNMKHPASFLLIIMILTGYSAFADDATSITRHTFSPGDVTGEIAWSDSLVSNGGDMAVQKNTGFDSQNQQRAGHNLYTEKVLTYAGLNGSHLMGGEQFILRISGAEYPAGSGSLSCTFTPWSATWIPAFCDLVQVKTDLINVNSAQISATGRLRMVGEMGVPAGLSYRVGVTPDRAVSTGAAEGTIITTISGDLQEARGDDRNESAVSRWRDASSASGSVKTFIKTLNYESGFQI